MASTSEIRAVVAAFRDELDDLDAHATVGIGVHLVIIESQIGELDRELAALAERQADAARLAEAAAAAEEG